MRVEDKPTIHERLRKNSGDFAMEIEDMVRRRKLGYIEAILEYCETHNIDLSSVKDMVQGTLKSKLEAEAESLHFLPRRSKLPI